MLRLGVLVSGGGTNLQAVIDKIKTGYLSNVCINIVVSGREDAYALKRANDNGIKTAVLRRKDFCDQASYDIALSKILKDSGVDLVVLAGFMTVLGEDFVRSYIHRMINIHPSLVPAFCGKGFYGIVPHRAALAYGVKVSGATVHFVDAGTDTGPVIIQKAVDIEGITDENILQKKIMEECEWEILPEALKLISEGRVTVDGRKVTIDAKRDHDAGI
jgi:phosphoribosylglycinamide formyltransferase 1